MMDEDLALKTDSIMIDEDKTIIFEFEGNKKYGVKWFKNSD